MSARYQLTPLAQLINDYSDTLAFVGLQLETISNHYLNKQKSATYYFSAERSNESQSNFYQFLTQNFSRWSVKQCEILIEMLKNDLLLKGAQSAYVRVYCERMKDIAIKKPYIQLKQKAIQQFNKLPRNEQMQYLAYYIQEIQIFESAHQSSKQLYSHFGQSYNIRSQGQKFAQNGMYLDGINLSFLSGFNSNDLLAREYARQTPNFGNNQFKKNQGKGINSQYNQADSRNKNDIYRLALGNRVSQKPQKQNNKNEESKQKEQFQTLKSLFKKLQSDA